MHDAKRMAGQPLLFLFGLLAIWIMARMIAHWPVPAEAGQLRWPVKPSTDDPFGAAAGEINVPTVSKSGEQRSELANANTRFAVVTASSPTGFTGQSLPERMAKADPATSAMHHQLYAMAMGYPALALAFYQSPSTPRYAAQFPPVTSRPKTPADRWSIYGWAFVRSGSGSGVAAGAAQYGGSQAGAILRYRLLPGSHPSLNAYARVSRAFGGPAQKELALGVAGRPVPQIPIAFAAERRVNPGEGGRNAYAVYANTEIGPQQLASAITAEIYGQAGWVSGSGSTRQTGFFDAQATATRAVNARLSAGGGIWAGGQRGAARLDIGPRLLADLPLGSGNGRVALDARQRIAGDAMPASGVALTFSAAF